MIQTYDETWKYYVRLKCLTPRRGEFMPYVTIDTIYNYILACDDKVLDIGCGENNLKLGFPDKIVGFDRTNEADVFGYQYDDSWYSLPHFKYGIAINSLHWGNIGANISEALTKCDKLYITLNENQDISEWKLIDTWKKYGNVEYFWHGQKNRTLQNMSGYLENDDFYKYQNRDISLDVTEIANMTIHKDPFFGVVRVIIANN